ncbi:MAG: amidase [Chroococcidiopsidaceae cyanobacterium CP_BM_RX_35]|nr:amidase [Chroococcidiopsidaceae cyanobacterium CP_BM_RX_35]
MSELVFLPAHQLAQRIRERTVSAIEVLEAYLAQIAKHNSELNAICILNEGAARQHAQQADAALVKGEYWGVLHGVPITIKDYFETAGLSTLSGYQPFKDYVPQHDATAVARVRAAGAIILGKTTATADPGGDYQGINDRFPRVNNPWNLNYTPGGTSSGSAAAVAAGFSPLDICSDNGGSIRQPAHFCGVFGLKPTDRRVPTTGHVGDLPNVSGMPRCIRQMFTVGAIARSVEDLRLALQLIAGADPRQPDIPPVPLAQPVDNPLQNLRIAWIDELPSYPVAADIKSAMQTVAKRLGSTDTNIERWSPEFDFVAAWQVYYAVGTYNLLYSQPINFTNVQKQMMFLWREATQGERAWRKLSNVPSIALPLFLNPTLKGYFQALTERDSLIAQMDKELEQWDVWLCPVAMTPAFTHRAKGEAVEIEGRKVPYQMASGAYLVPFNLTGHPVVVVPIGNTQSGLPIGMQIVGKRWREMELLTISQKLMEVVGQFQLPPGYSSSVYP